MSDSSPTPWLRAGSGAPAELRELLSSARADEPTAEQLKDLTHKLAPLLVAGAVGAVATSASAATASTAAAGTGVAGGTSAAVGTASAVKLSVFSTLTAKVVLGTLGAVAVVGGAVQANRTLEARRVEAPVRQLMVPAPAPVVDPVKPLEVVVPTVDEPAIAPPAAPEPVKAQLKRAEPAPQPVVAPPAPLEPTDAEVKLLEAAMGALKRGDAATALQLTERHARDFSDGLLVQEREVLAIEALVQDGRVPQARSRAERFQQRFPGSTHQLKVDALLDGR